MVTVSLHKILSKNYWELCPENYQEFFWPTTLTQFQSNIPKMMKEFQESEKWLYRTLVLINRGILIVTLTTTWTIDLTPGASRRLNIQYQSDNATLGEALVHLDAWITAIEREFTYITGIPIELSITTKGD